EITTEVDTDITLKKRKIKPKKKDSVTELVKPVVEGETEVKESIETTEEIEIRPDITTQDTLDVKPGDTEVVLETTPEITTEVDTDITLKKRKIKPKKKDSVTELVKPVVEGETELKELVETTEEIEIRPDITTQDKLDVKPGD